jgi:hypothetical protein
MLARLIKIIYRIYKYFSLISNEVLISLHHWLDLTHTNCPAVTHVVFNYILYGYSFILYALIINVII